MSGFLLFINADCFAAIPKTTPMTEAFQIIINRKIVLIPKRNAVKMHTKSTLTLFEKIELKSPKSKIFFADNVCTKSSWLLKSWVAESIGIKMEKNAKVSKIPMNM